jgi:hypothetical protein
LLPLFVSPQIAVGNRTRDPLACHALCFENGFDFFACVLCVKFVHDVPKRREIVLAPNGIYAVIQGD